MTKIFITGFKHSGTTMTMQLIKAHPQVGWIENEEGYIEFDKPKEWVLMMAKKQVSDMKKYSWGEKIPWGIRSSDKDGKRAIRMIKKWFKFFGKDAKVIQVLRHPADVFLSDHDNIIKKKEMDWLINTVEKVIDFINKDKRCGVVVYEELVTYPEIVIPKIFDFLRLKTNKKLLKLFKANMQKSSIVERKFL